MKKILFRLQEVAAGQFASVQYPQNNRRIIGDKPPFMERWMNFWMRVGLGASGIILGAFALALIGLGLLALYLIVVSF
jgi:hypothetical protein